MFFWELFEIQDVVYKELVLLKVVIKCFFVEVVINFGWYKYVGMEGDIVSIEIFGVLVFGGVCFEKFGFSVDNVLVKVKIFLSQFFVFKFKIFYCFFF